jgi:multisubunit Na+/H+ antiporter MnhG subunit
VKKAGGGFNMEWLRFFLGTRNRVIGSLICLSALGIGLMFFPGILERMVANTLSAVLGGIFRAVAPFFGLVLTVAILVMVVRSVLGKK